jgi:hypothetical protein
MLNTSHGCTHTDAGDAGYFDLQADCGRPIKERERSDVIL